MKARAEVVQLQAALTLGDSGNLSARLTEIDREAQAARTMTSDPVWAGLSQVPWLGSSLRAAHEVAVSVDQVARDVLPPLLRATDLIAPQTLRQPDGALQLNRLVAAVPDLRVAIEKLASVRGKLRTTSGSEVIPAVSKAQTTLAASLAGLAGGLDTAYRAAQIAPEMLGANGVRRYLVIFETPAEARGTGGLAGSYAVIRFDHGRLTTERSGSDTDFKNAPAPVVDLGQGYRDRYGQTGGASEWSAANWTPNYPWAAQVWAKLWQRQSGEYVDGVISVDPIALGYFLSVTGPVTLSNGEVITSANAARWVMSDSYRIFADDQTLRKRMSVELSKRTLNLLSSTRTDLPKLLKVLGRAAGERRLLLWSAHPSDEALIAGTPAAGQLADAPGPFADLVLRNGGGNKLDYYLDRSLSYQVVSCTPQSREVRVSFTLTNSAPKSGLPSYVSGRVDGRKVPVGQNRIYADLFLAQGAKLQSWNLNGRAIPTRLSIELGHSVAEFDLELPLGEPQTVTVLVAEPPSTQSVVIPVQPLARGLAVHSNGHC